MTGGAVIVGSSKGEGHPKEKGDGVFNSSSEDVDDGRWSGSGDRSWGNGVIVGVGVGCGVEGAEGGKGLGQIFFATNCGMDGRALLKVNAMCRMADRSTSLRERCVEMAFLMARSWHISNFDAGGGMNFSLGVEARVARAAITVGRPLAC